MNYEDLIIYHSADLDGNGSGFIVASNDPNPFDLLGYNYEYDLLEKVSKKYPAIYIVDLNLNLEIVEELSKRTDYLLYIDHHVHRELENSEFYEVVSDDVNIVINKDYAAIALTYSFIHNIDLYKEYNKLPLYIQFLEKYDRWNLSDDVVYFQNYCNRINLDISTIEGYDNWFRLKYFDSYNSISSALKLGKNIEAYFNNYISKKFLSESFEGKIGDHGVLFVNSPLRTSKVFGNKIMNYDFVVSFFIKKEKVYMSFYTERNDIDVSSIAMEFGGGGHRKAAGCIVDMSDFLKFIGG